MERPASVSALSLESYLELYNALTANSAPGSSTVGPISAMESAWFKMKDLQLVLQLHGLGEPSKPKKKELLDAMLGMALYPPLPSMTPQEKSSTRSSGPSANAALPAQGAAQQDAVAQGPKQDAKTRGDAPGGPQQAAPPLRKQARITTFFPSPSPQTVTPFPRDITRVSPQDLASLGWLQVDEHTKSAFAQPFTVLRRRPVAPSNPKPTAPHTVDTGATPMSTNEAAAPIQLATQTDPMQQTHTIIGPVMGVAAPVAISTGPTQLGTQLQQTVHHPTHTAHRASIVQPAQPAVQPAAQPAAKPVADTGAAATEAAAGRQHAGTVTLASQGDVSTSQADKLSSQCDLPASQCDVPVGGQGNGGASRVAWLAGEVLRFSQTAGVTTSSEILISQGQLIKRRVGFVLPEPMTHSEGIIPAGLHQAAVVRYIGSSCIAGLCERGCAGAHQYCSVRLLGDAAPSMTGPTSTNAGPSKRGTGSGHGAGVCVDTWSLELTLDLSLSHRLMTFDQLIPLADDTQRLEDAWLLLRARPVWHDDSCSSDGDEDTHTGLGATHARGSAGRGQQGQGVHTQAARSAAGGRGGGRGRKRPAGTAFRRER